MVFHFTLTAADIPVFLTLVLLEGALSFDNAAVLAALTRKLPIEQRRRALLYGLVGAYVFRVLAILLVAFIIDNPWLKIAGGAYLLYLALRHLWPGAPHDAGTAKVHTGMFGLSLFWSTVVAVELADIAFALDQVLVAVALTDKIPLIIIAALFAILLLRLSAFYMSLLMDWFPALERFAYLAVGFVGFKMLLEELVGIEIHHEIAVGVTLSILVVPVLVKVGMDMVRKRRRTA